MHTIHGKRLWLRQACIISQLNSNNGGHQNYQSVFGVTGNVRIYLFFGLFFLAGHQNSLAVWHFASWFLQGSCVIFQTSPMTHAIVLCFPQIRVKEGAGLSSGICLSVSSGAVDPWAGLLALQPAKRLLGFPIVPCVGLLRGVGVAFPLSLSFSPLHSLSLGHVCIGKPRFYWRSFHPSIHSSWRCCSSRLLFHYLSLDFPGFRRLLQVTLIL